MSLVMRLVPISFTDDHPTVCEDGEEGGCTRAARNHTHSSQLCNNQRTSISIWDFKQLTFAKVCRDGLTDVVVECRSNDHTTTGVAKVSVAPR